MWLENDRKLTEPLRDTPIVLDADVVVCGGGPGGVPAAIAAARHGARTVLIERYGFLGGLATAGLVAPILGHKAPQSSTPVVAGILREITERMHVLGGCQSWAEVVSLRGIRFDAEAMKVVLDEMCLEAGVELLLHTYIADVITEDKAVKAIIVQNKSGRQAIVGRVFVDATGDADVAFRAGAPTTYGRSFDSLVEAMGSFYHLAGYQPVAEGRVGELQKLVQREMAEGRLHFTGAGFLSQCAYHTDHTSPNMTRAGGSPTVARDMTRAELSVRRDIWNLVGFLRASVLGFEDVYVQQTACQVGPRESRQVVGPYAITGDDVIRGTKFMDAVTRGSWKVDIHCPFGLTYPVQLCYTECVRGADCPFWRAEHNTMISTAHCFPPDGDWYDIPYRSLLSIAVPNLLSSGRCVSATHEGMSSSRVMGTCMGIGQAAGVAAAMAVGTGGRVGDVDVARLRELLRADGALV